MATCIKTCKANGHPKSTQLKGKTVVGGGGGPWKIHDGGGGKIGQVGKSIHCISPRTSGQKSRVSSSEMKNKLN